MRGTESNRVIQVHGVSKVYRSAPRIRDLVPLLLQGQRTPVSGKRALHNLSLGVDAGTSLAVVGRNGSGKTTLLRLLAGVFEPTEGEIHVRGRVAALLDLGAGIDPEFSGRENALLLGVLAGASRREMRARLDSVRDFSGLGGAFEERTRAYSSGMLLRLAFSTAVHAEPEILLIDEMLAVGDAFFQQRCLLRIRQLQQRGCSVVLVTHDPSAAINFCDRGIWLEHGAIACAGEPGKVVREYLGALYRDGAELDESPVECGVGIVTPICADLDSVADIPNVDHRYGNGRARIEGIALRDAAGKAVGAPLPGQLVRIVITVGALEHLTAPLVGFTLRDRLGEIITATNTTYEDRTLPTLAPADRITVEFTFRWPAFSSGTFSISPAVADGSLDRHTMLDWIDNAFVLEALNPEARYGWIRLEDVSVRCALDRGPRT